MWVWVGKTIEKGYLYIKQAKHIKWVWEGVGATQ